MFFRNNQQVFLNELLLKLKDSSHCLSYEAELMDAEESLRQTFKNIARDRERLCQKLEEIIRTSDDLPSGVDNDKQAMEDVYDWLQAKFYNHNALHFVEQRLAQDHQIYTAIIDSSGSNGVLDNLVVLKQVKSHLLKAEKELQRWQVLLKVCA